MHTIEELKSMSDENLNDLMTSRLLIDADHDTFINHLKMRNVAGLEFGRRQGWWEDFTMEAPIPFPIVVSASEFEGLTMAHVMAHVKHFKSVSEAKKNGWDKPIEFGVFKVGKKRKVEIV